jgi:hypothetical protein
LKPYIFSLVRVPWLFYTFTTLRVISQVINLITLRVIRIPMGKPVPQGKKSVYVIMPEELHRRITLLVSRGGADALICECLQEPIAKRWEQWIRGHARDLDKPKK